MFTSDLLVNILAWEACLIALILNNWNDRFVSLCAQFMSQDMAVTTEKAYSNDKEVDALLEYQHTLNTEQNAQTSDKDTGSKPE